jgi:hypothetical protein
MLNSQARILKAEKRSEIPLLLPTKYELLLNLQTAEALGLSQKDFAARRRGDRMNRRHFIGRLYPCRAATVAQSGGRI